MPTDVILGFAVAGMLPHLRGGARAGAAYVH